MKAIKLLLITLLLLIPKQGIRAQCAPVLGDQTTYGNDSWIGYVYSNYSTYSSSPSSTTGTYAGYVTQTETFNQDFGTGSISGSNVCGSYADNFGIRFKMQKTLAAGYYTFTVGADDGYRLSIDGGATWLINVWGISSYRTSSSSSLFLSGTTNLVLEYFENNGLARVSFSYQACLVSSPPTAITGTTAICSGASTTLTAVGATLASGSTYQWGTGSTVGSNIISGQTGSSIVVSPTTTTSYWVRVVSASPCSLNTTAVTTTVNVTANPGDQTSYGNESWIGYVYSNYSYYSSPPSSTTGTYVGYVTQAETFDQNLGTGSISGSNICGSYADYFGIRFKMQKTLAAGYYTFTVGADDGYRLSIDGGATWLIQYWGISGYGTTSSSRLLLSGTTNLVLEYFENGDLSRISFSYQFCPISSPPTDLTGTTSICSGASTTLTAVGATLATGATYQWGTGSTVGANIISGQTASTITVSPSSSTTYWVRVVSPAPCSLTTAGVSATVTVNPINTAGTASSTPTLCINSALTAITHTTTSATGIGTATGLPTGVNANWSGNVITISGTPTAAGTFNYSIPLTGGCGTVNATGRITVTPANTAGTASSTPTLCINSALTAITHTTTGATGIGTAMGLPTGVNANWSANVITISGTPTAAGTFNYSIPLTAGCGTANATGTITVTPTNTAGTASSTPTLCINSALTAITHTTTGATGIGSATGLPTGVNANWSGNVITISGTPAAAGTFNYSIPLTGGCGTVNATGTITVNINTVGTASSTPTLCINSALTAITHTTTRATGIGTATGLPTGVNANWSANVITISGTPTAAGTFNYSIPLTGGCGTVNATGTITVTPANTVGTASSTPTLCINSALTAITHTTTGATGIGTATGLPTGVNANWSANLITISGTPTAAGTFSYSIPLTGGCGAVNATGTITVTPANTVGTASSTPTLCINSALTAITHTTTGATGIGTASGLPTGVDANWSANVITISGTPTAAGTFNYSIPLTGGCGTVNATGTITVTPASVAGFISGATTVCTGSNSTTLTLSGNTGAVQWQSSANNASFSDISGATSTTYTVSNISANAYFRAVVTNGVCASATTDAATMAVNTPSVAGTASGATTVCSGTNSSDISLAGQNGTIQWQVSGDNSSFAIIFGANASTYTATDLTANRYYRAVVTNGVCSSATSNAVTITVNSLSNGGVLGGSTTVPTGTNSTTLTVTGYNGNVVQWQSSSAADFSSNVGNISSNNSNNNSYTYTANNLTATTYYRAIVKNGVCGSAYTTIASVIVDTTLGGTVSGGATYCSTTNSTTLTLSGYSGTISKWQSSSSSDFSSNTVDIPNTANTLLVTNVASTTYYRAIITNGSFAPKHSTSAIITYNTPNLTIGNINGLQSLCGLNQTTYSIDTVVGATNYVWTFPAGISVVSNALGNSVVVNIDSLFQEGTITAMAYNACTTTSVKSIDVLKKPVILTISGPTSTCGISTATYSATLSPTDQNATYTWTVPSGFTIISGAGTANITVSIDNNVFTGTGYVNAQAVSACGSSPIKYVTVSAVQSPSTIIGNEQVCGLTTASYRTPAVTAASSYTWTVPTGMTITSGQGTNQIAVAIDQSIFTSGQVAVAANSDCGGSTPLKMLVNKTQKPSTISGPTALCGVSEITYDTTGNIVNVNSGNVTYTVAAIAGATNYAWTVPTGFTIVSGQGTNSIRVSINLAQFTSGNVAVSFTNSCGSSLPSTLAVKRSGTFITGYTQLCTMNSNITYSVPATVGSNFNWSVPSWMNIVSGQGTNLLTVSVTGNICTDQVTLNFISNCNTSETINLAVGCNLSSKLTADFCGGNVPSEFTLLYANTVTGASAYKFKVSKGAAVQYITNATAAFSINQFTGWAYGDSYTIEVAPIIGGVTYNYGCVCSVTLINPTPSIQASQCGTSLTSLDSRIYCSNVPSATAYRFEVSAGSSTRTVDVSTNSFSLSQLSGTTTYGTAYSVRVAAFYNGAWSSSSTSCTVTSPNLPTTRISESVCGTTLSSVWTSLYAGQIPGVAIAAYRFEVTDTNTNTVYTVDAAANNFNLMQITGGARFATTYSIKVAVKVGTNWQAYGTACTVTTPNPTTAVVATQCGVTVASIWTPIYASAINGATGYSFEVTNGSNTRTLVRSSNSFQLGNLAGGATLNTTYTVRVAAIYNGYLQPYGTACTIKTGSARLNESVETQLAFAARVFPNPFESNFGLSIDTSSLDDISVQVFDMLGKQVDARTVSTQEIGSVTLGDNYPSGVYQIIVTQGTETKVLRAIKR